MVMFENFNSCMKLEGLSSSLEVKHFCFHLKNYKLAQSLEHKAPFRYWQLLRKIVRIHINVLLVLSKQNNL